MGVLDVLTIIFIVLKLVGVINWSWIWVLSPTIIGIIVYIIVVVLDEISINRFKKKLRGQTRRLK